MILKISIWALVAIGLSTFVVVTAFGMVSWAKKVLELKVKMPWYMRLTAYFWLAIGVPADLIFNYTMGSWEIGELPDWGDWTFSARIQSYADSGKHKEDTRRFSLILNAGDKGHIRL